MTSSSTKKFLNSGMRADTLAMISSNWKHTLMTDQPISKVIAMISLVISSIQMLSLNFEAATLNLHANNAVSSILSMTLTRRAFSHLEFNSTDILIVVVATSYMVLFLAFNIIAFYTAMKKVQRVGNLPLMWKGWGYIHLLVLSLPFHNLALDFVYACFNQSDNSAGHVIDSIMAILFAFINIVLCIIHINFSFVVKTKDPFSRTNNLYFLSVLITKILQSTFNCLALRFHNQAMRIVATVFAFFLSTINQAVIASSWPFYKEEFNQMICYGGVLNLVASTIASLILIDDNVSADSLNIFAFLSIFLIFATIGGKLNKMFFNYKLVRLNQKRLSSKLTSFQTYWWIQRFRFIKSLLSKTLVPDTSEKEFQMLGLFQAGLIKTLLRDLNISSNTIPIKEERREYLYQIFYSTVNHNPKNHLLRLVLANYLIKDSNNLYEPSILLQQTLSDKDAPFNIKLSAALLQKKIQGVIEKHTESRSEDKLDLKSYFLAIELYEELKTLIDKYLNLLERFYRILEDMTINSSTLVHLSAKLQRTSRKIHKYWETIPHDITEKKKEFYLTYAIFNTCFNYDLKKGRSHFNKYRSAAKRNLESSKSNIIANKDLYDGQSMSFLFNFFRLNTY